MLPGNMSYLRTFPRQPSPPSFQRPVTAVSSASPHSAMPCAHMQRQTCRCVGTHNRLKFANSSSLQSTYGTELPHSRPPAPSIATSLTLPSLCVL
jgi:hypothetical protein